MDSSPPYQRCSLPTFPESVRNDHWPHRLTISGTDKVVVFSAAGSARALIVPAARTPACVRNFRRECTVRFGVRSCHGEVAVNQIFLKSVKPKQRRVIL